MKAKLFIISYVLLFIAYGQQPFQVLHYRPWGGNKGDLSYVTKQYNDSLFIVGGFTESTSGFISALYGLEDGFITFFDYLLNPVKTLIIGGNENERVMDVIKTDWGTILILFHTTSIDSIFSANNGYIDAGLLPYDFQTNWTGQVKLFGGSDADVLESISRKNAGGYLLAGSSMSNDGNLNHNFGGEDCWVLNLSPTLNLIWSKNYGGSYTDVCIDAFQLADGNIIVVGNTYSNDHMVHHYRGGKDVWVVKLNSMGDTIWTKTLGGGALDEVFKVKLLQNSNIMLAGFSSSYDGDFFPISLKEKLSTHVAFLYVIDKDGNFQFAAYQFIPSELFIYTDVYPLDNNNFIVAGLHADQSMKITALLSRFNNDSLLHSQEFDYGFSDVPIQLLANQNSEFILTNITNSPFIPQFQGHYDILLLKVKYNFSQIAEALINNFNLFPNPTSDYITLTFTEEFVQSTYTIHTFDGKILQQGVITEPIFTMPINILKPGTYFISVNFKNLVLTKAFHKQ